MNEEGVISEVRAVPRRSSGHFCVLVANTKGGCGKTTLSTNLASYYARRGTRVSLLDLDPQQSAGVWLNLRHQSGMDDIQGLTFSATEHIDRGRLQDVIRQARSHLIIDSPAGLSGPSLDALLSVSQVVLVPVLPSPIDIRAATRFLQMIMLSRSYQRRPRRLAVIANRARERTLMFSQLERFLDTLKIPYLTSLRDTQLYVQASGEGKGLADLDESRARNDLRQWKRLVEWLEIQRQLIRTMPGF